MGQEFLNLVDPDEAENIIKSLKIGEKTEKTLLNDCNRRILANDVISSMDLPPFNRVSMDGYAIKASDSFQASDENPVFLKLIGSVSAGEAPKTIVEESTCIEVATGAPMPPGADAVVMIEYTEKRGDNIVISEGVAPGQFIALQGSDVKEGQKILEKNTYLTPDKIGVLSAVGASKVLVYSKPKVGIISTGNEIIRSKEKLHYGQIYDINSYTISAAVEECGCIPLEPLVVRDDYELLKNSILIFEDADIIITSGGTSAGRGDVLREVVDDLGQVLLHGIAFKPGKPTLVGLINDKIIIGLPGYPVSALMVFKSFTESLFRRMAHMPSVNVSIEIFKMQISRTFRSARGRRENLLVKIKDGKVHPILKDSGAISALADADGYIEIPKNTEYIEEDSIVEVRSFNY